MNNIVPLNSNQVAAKPLNRAGLWSHFCPAVLGMMVTMKRPDSCAGCGEKPQHQPEPPAAA